MLRDMKKHGYKSRPMSEWTAEQREKQRVYERARYAAWPAEKKAARSRNEHVRTLAKARYWKNHETTRDKYYWYSIARIFGLSRAQYEEMFRTQGGVCAICGNSPNMTKKRFKLCVDHNHITGK